MKSDNKQQITDNKIFFGSFIFLFFVLSSLFFVRQTQAAANYPIPELGNCRNGQECKFYCEIPANTPACWSYGKYVMNNDARGDAAGQVLGETTANISYPIADLGNCRNGQECFLYCAQPQNQEACVSYAKNNGLVKDEPNGSNNDINEQELVGFAKTELGCSSKDACMALCNDPTNADKCRAFAQKHGLEKEGEGPDMKLMEEAKTELGCDSRSSCSSFCQKPENGEKCFEFAKKNKLMKEEELKKMEQMKEQGQKLLETAKTELGCDSKDSCMRFCTEAANREKCASFGQKMGMTKEGGPVNKPQTPCTGEAECKNYCQVHPDECPGASGRPNTNASDTALQKPDKKGEFLGPSGCKSEEECKDYCEKYPDKCPGFPKKPDMPMDQQSQTPPSGKYGPTGAPPQQFSNPQQFPGQTQMQQQTQMQPQNQMQQQPYNSNPPPPPSTPPPPPGT